MKRASKNSFNIYLSPMRSTIESKRCKSDTPPPLHPSLPLPPPIRIIPRGGINNKGFRENSENSREIRANR